MNWIGQINWDMIFMADFTAFLSGFIGYFIGSQLSARRTAQIASYEANKICASALQPISISMTTALNNFSKIINDMGKSQSMTLEAAEAIRNWHLSAQKQIKH